MIRHKAADRQLTNVSVGTRDDDVEGVACQVGRLTDMLNTVERPQQIDESCRMCVVGVVNVDIEVAGDDERSKTLHINFYQNRSSIVEVMIKNFGVFLCPTVYI